MQFDCRTGSIYGDLIAKFASAANGSCQIIAASVPDYHRCAVSAAIAALRKSIDQSQILLGLDLIAKTLPGMLGLYHSRATYSLSLRVVHAFSVDGASAEALHSKQLVEECHSIHAGG